MKERDFLSEKGQVLILAAVFLGGAMLMFSYVGGLGQLFTTDSYLQNAADAGALAGGNAMGNAKTTGEITSMAENVARGTTPKTDNALIVEVIPDMDKAQVKVTVQKDVTLIGGLTFTRTATATAAVTTATSISTAPPFVIQAPKDLAWTGNHSQEYTMKKNPSSSEKDTFTYIDVMFKKSYNMQQYLDYLANGYEDECTLDTPLYYVARAEAGATAVRYFASRFEADSNTDINKIKVGDKRLMIIPLVDSFDNVPTNQSDWSLSTQGLKIVGFIGYWIESIDYGPGYGDKPYQTVTGWYRDQWGRNCYGTYDYYPSTYPDFKIKGRFVKVSLPAGSYNGYTNKFFGLSTVRLVE